MIPLPSSAIPQELPEAEIRFADLIPRGRVVELSGHGCTTLAVALVRKLQLEGEPVAWIEHQRGSLYPPDLAQAGIDLNALPLVLIDGSSRALAEAAELLLRSGSFGGVILDLGTHRSSLRDTWQSRLAALARKYDSRVLILTRKGIDEPSLGPMIGLRAHAHVLARQNFEIHIGLLKNKTSVSSRPAPHSCSGPLGLRLQ